MLESTTMTWRPPAMDRQARHNPCSICGSTSFKWGTPGFYIHFIPDDAPWLPLFGAVGRKNLDARLCENCGNVQMFSVSPLIEWAPKRKVKRKDYWTWLREQDAKKKDDTGKGD